MTRSRNGLDRFVVEDEEDVGVEQVGRTYRVFKDAAVRDCFYEAGFERSLDAHEWQPVILKNYGDTRYVGKGITPALFTLIVRDTRQKLMSSPAGSTAAADSYITVEAKRVWDQLVETGCAIWDAEGGRYRLVEAACLTEDERESILAHAARWIGTPYARQERHGQWEAGEPSSLDCSTMVARVCRDAVGGTIAPLAIAMRDDLSMVPKALPGDLVLYEKDATAADFPNSELAEELAAAHGTILHVMIYVGDGTVLGACDQARSVVRRPLEYQSGWRLLAAPFRRMPHAVR